MVVVVRPVPLPPRALSQETEPLGLAGLEVARSTDAWVALVGVLLEIEESESGKLSCPLAVSKRPTPESTRRWFRFT